LLLKIAPDLGYEEIDKILESALRHDIDGIIATNTTVSRDGLVSECRIEAGGLSGKPLADISNKIISYICSRVGDQLVVIGAGGIFEGADARKKLDSGASLIQVYTGLVYEGPRLASRLLRSI
jgi:dihydroorotate dehydrogenase